MPTKEAKSPRRWRAGDIIEVTLSDGTYRYLQLIGRYQEFADLLKVFKLRSNTRLNAADASKSATDYLVLSSAKVLALDNRYQVVGNVACTDEIPPMRRAFVGGWFIIDKEGERFVPSPLSKELAAISIEQGVPADLLAERLMSNWQPSDDVDPFPKRTFSQAQGKIDNTSVRTTRFFLHFGNEREALKGCKSLAALQCRIEDSEDQNAAEVVYEWKSTDSLSSVDAVEVEIAARIQRFGGQISGRETSA